MLYLFFYILHLYDTGIVKLFKNTFIFDIFCGAWSQKCGATLWHNCLECLFLFLLKKMMCIFTDIRQTNQKQCSVINMQKAILLAFDKKSIKQEIISQVIPI